MIAVKRTSRDSVGCILPVIAFFALVLSYVSLAANEFAPVYGNISSDAYWLAPPIALVLWLILLKYILGLIYPTTYLTEVFPDKVVFSDSSNSENPTIYHRIEVVRFYVQPQRWWHNSDAFYPVICEKKSGQTVEISWNYVYDNTSEPFFAAVRNMWGEDYAPAKQIERSAL